MNRMMRILTIATLLPVSGALLAHHSVTMFELATPVTVRGKVVRFEMTNPHSFLHVEQQTQDGPIVWAVEGPAPSGLVRRGVSAETFSEGDAVEACGYVLKEDAGDRYINRQVLVAEVMVLPGGAARLWSPYGQTLCREQNAYPDLVE